MSRGEGKEEVQTDASHGDKGHSLELTEVEGEGRIQAAGAAFVAHTSA